MARRGGWRRTGSRGRFRYFDSHGDRITDPDQLARVEALAIPPAWRDVWISPKPGAKLQATGVDAAGRRQYLYHSEFREAQERAKYEKLIRFGERLPQLRELMADHLELERLEPERVSAVAVRVINLGWFRVGSDRAARHSRTFGITTLRKRHVSVRGQRITFCFRGKGRAQVRTTLVDEELADEVRYLRNLNGGSRLFRYRLNGDLRPLTAGRLNDYIGLHLGDDFTAKDFRTWGGTLTAAVALAEHGPPVSETEAKSVLASVMRRVGEELGNTAAVARTSYVSPAVVEQYREGITLERFSPNGSRPLSATQRGLSRDERALLSLLRSWRMRRARVTD
jgi:DNA topoisomerase-1